MPAPLVEIAPAKINLTLRVVGRRADGYHELESLVVFADFGDRLSFVSGSTLALTVRGPTAKAAGAGTDNLVLKAARALAANAPGMALGAFRLDKRLPVAAGIGGGSADAGAALRLLARANGLALDDPRLFAAARAAGADVPVCLDPRARIMHGVGEILSAALTMPSLPAVLVNPGVALPTKDVFAGWKPAGATTAPLDPGEIGTVSTRAELVRYLAAQSNDLEAPAIALAPQVADALDALRALKGCQLARMSGSGATCFGLFASVAASREAAKILRSRHSQWWAKAATLGAAQS